MHNFKHAIMQVVLKQNFNSIILIITEKIVIKFETKFVQYPFLKTSLVI